MFETAELGQKVTKEEFKERVPILRQQLLMAQMELRKARFPVILLFGGVDGAGKGDLANLLNSWLDARRIWTRAYGLPTDDERERPPYWKFWRDLPPNGHIGIFLSAWYSKPLLQRVHGEIGDSQFEEELSRIAEFERTLAVDGAVILKFWMHLGKEAQRMRFETLESDPLQAWRVTKRDWKHWEMYDQFISAAERLIMKTSTGEAPWTIVEGTDPGFRTLEAGAHILQGIRRGLAAESGRHKARKAAKHNPGDEEASGDDESGSIMASIRTPTVLSTLDMEKKLPKDEYEVRLDEAQAHLNLLHRRARDRKVSTIIVLEGWDAAGKGGAIRRLVTALDARDYEVIQIAAPTDEEKAHHYLWRFWRHLPRAGKVTIFDRSWYGRVMVERIEGFATEEEWRRAYAEINEFEDGLVSHGMVLVKFWIHITQEKQEERFLARAETPYKAWKLTDEDWRNREHWEAYENVVNDFVERTSTRTAPWILVEGNDKRYARVRVIEEVCSALERVLGEAEGEGPASAGEA